MTNNLPRLSIGLPVYDRTAFLGAVLDCLKGQTFQAFEVVVSDNASPHGRIREVFDAHVGRDPRFRYVRHDKALPVIQHFRYVFEETHGPYFMWAADDDLWAPAFAGSAVAALDLDAAKSAWFCQIENIDAAGASIRSYPDFRRFTASGDKAADLSRYLNEPEILGKANLWYSVYRRPALADALAAFARSEMTAWGADMAMVYGFMCRYDHTIDGRVLFRKRIDQATGPIVICEPRDHIYPSKKWNVYRQNFMVTASGTPWESLTRQTLDARRKSDRVYGMKRMFGRLIGR